MFAFVFKAQQTFLRLDSFFFNFLLLNKLID